MKKKAVRNAIMNLNVQSDCNFYNSKVLKNFMIIAVT